MSSKQGDLPVKSWREVDGVKTGLAGYDLSEHMVCIVGGSWLLRQDGEPTIGEFKKMPMGKKKSDLGKMYSLRKVWLLRVIGNKKLLEKKIRLHRRKNKRKTIELPVVAHHPRVAQPPPPSPPPELGLNKLETAAWKDQQRVIIRKKTQSPDYIAAAVKQGILRAKVNRDLVDN